MLSRHFLSLIILSSGIYIKEKVDLWYESEHRISLKDMLESVIFLAR